MSANVSFSCSDIYNVSGSTYAVEQEDGGIPENLGVFFFSPNFGPVYFVAPATTLVMLGLEGAVSVNLFILYHNGLSFVIA